MPEKPHDPFKIAFAEAIMEFEAMMSHVDWAISFIVQEQGLEPPITGDIFTAHLTALPRASILNSLFHCLTEDSSPLRKRFTSLRKLTIEVIEERNTIVHSAYGSSPYRDIETDGMKGFLYRHGAKGVTHRHEEYSSKHLSFYAKKCNRILNANTIATLAVLGHPVKLSRLDSSLEQAKARFSD